jgi:hypothetical protein
MLYWVPSAEESAVSSSGWKQKFLTKLDKPPRRRGAWTRLCGWISHGTGASREIVEGVIAAKLKYYMDEIGSKEERNANRKRDQEEWAKAGLAKTRRLRLAARRFGGELFEPFPDADNLACEVGACPVDRRK